MSEREDAAYAAFMEHDGRVLTADSLGGGPEDPPSVAELRRVHMEMTYGTSWNRPALDLQTKSLLTLAILATLGDQEEQLARHLTRAHRVGVSKEQVVDLLFHLSGYVGVPRAAKATATIREVWSRG